jgi:hypothetical protein
LYLASHKRQDTGWAPVAPGERKAKCSSDMQFAGVSALSKVQAEAFKASILLAFVEPYSQNRFLM